MAEGLTQNLMEELKQGYLASLPGRIADIERYTLALEKGADFAEDYSALYRAVHSLKGSGGTYGFPIITNICHQLEDWLVTIENYTTIRRKQADILLSFVDILCDAVDKIRDTESTFGDIERQLADLKKRSSKNKLNGLVVDRSATNASIVAESLGYDKVQLAVAKDGVSALSRLMTESFDFVITSQEVGSLNGSAMIAALKLSRGVSHKTKTLLMTSNTALKEPSELQPDVVIKKDADLAYNIAQSMQLLGFSTK